MDGGGKGDVSGRNGPTVIAIRESRRQAVSENNDMVIKNLRLKDEAERWKGKV